MAQLNPIAAEVLEASAAGYAAAANAVHRESTLRSGGTAAYSSNAWTAHFKQRILELAAAVRVNEPGLFAERVSWLRRAFQARGTDVADLKHAVMSLKTALEQEFPEDLRAVVSPPLALALDEFDNELQPDVTHLDQSSATGRLGLEYIGACLAGDPDRAIEIVLGAIGGTLSAEDALTRVVIPVQKEIGQLWHVGELSVLEERVISETTGRLMTLICHQHGRTATAAGPTVIAASVAGNAHDLGLRVICELFRLAGWRCLFLGADVPASEIARSTETFSADLIVLNATLTTQLKELHDAINEIKRASPTTPVLIGGLALRDAPNLWRELGADAYAETVDQAIQAGARLVKP